MGYGLNMGYPILGYPMFSPCIGNGEHVQQQRSYVATLLLYMSHGTPGHGVPEHRD